MLNGAKHTFRRIITSHDPSDTTGDSVTFHDDTIPLKPVLDGNAHMSPLYSSPGLPTTSPHQVTPEHVTKAMANVQGVVMPGGVNGQVTVLEPNFFVKYHRTSSVDYNIMLEGSAWLIVPDGKGGERKTEVKAGEMVVQTGTLHAWQAGPNGSRWVTVVVHALPVEKDGKVLEDVDFK
ncbi:hypothetical protein CI109_100678 [Kwoniella shandongensis]|uniref:Uncharacterized protein n=1 Tax=Kwoniella shandongensis TaxID=1734106 RepID=A0A5M6BZF6_9TREE|nr:uncharacterized protein CI109_003401 [Kwoniella shandongensis]KAA5528113.1 hypothetical protein CI109_003401 [Kwoniella shandongensis]